MLEKARKHHQNFAANHFEEQSSTASKTAKLDQVLGFEKLDVQEMEQKDYEHKFRTNVRCIPILFFVPKN